MGRYQLASTPFPPMDQVHGGTGVVKNSRHSVRPSSVTTNYKDPLIFDFLPYEIRVLSVEIDELVAPNWFGVAFRADISSFDSINLFFHPVPGGATPTPMLDPQYNARAGGWPRLFRYAEMFGSQMDFAHSDLITIVPFFTNATYYSTGIFGPNWLDICTDIVALARNEAAQSGSTKINNVVLSNFSYGRVLMYNFLANSKGVDDLLREIWDFDGVTGPPPYTRGKARGILYDQKSSNDTHAFHLPGIRWVPFNHALVHDNHGGIPNMLAWHAATLSFFG